MQPSRLWMRSGLHRWTLGFEEHFHGKVAFVWFLKVWLGQSTQYCSQDDPSFKQLCAMLLICTREHLKFWNLARVESLRCLCQESFKPTRVVKNDACGCRITLIRRKMQRNSLSCMCKSLCWRETQQREVLAVLSKTFCLRPVMKEFHPEKQRARWRITATGQRPKD